MSPALPETGAAGPVGVLAGRGAVVIDLVEAVVRGGRQVHVVAIAGFASSDVQRFPHTWVGLGQLGGMLAALRRAGCRDLVIIGGIDRPDLTRLGFDFGAIRHARDIHALTKGGDDGMLRVVVRFFEGQGFAVRGVAEIAPELVAPAGHFAGPPLAPDHIGTIARGRRALAALAPFDMGQAVVAGPDGIVAWEAAEGTARMLARLADGTAPSGAVLVKLPKRGQELRIDLPTIGAETIAQARAAGLAGIAVAAGQTVLAARADLLGAADEAGLFVVGLPPVDASVTTATAAPVKAADDVALARKVSEEAASQTASPSGAIAAVARRGHVLALEADAARPGRLADRMANLPRGWGSLIPFSRAGALHVRLAAGNSSVGTDVAALAAVLRKSRLAEVAVVAVGQGAAAGAAALADAARIAGVRFRCEVENQDFTDDRASS